MRGVLVVGLIFSVVGSACAATYVVNSTLDTDDAAADTVCDDGAGHCTLRAAIPQSTFQGARRLTLGGGTSGLFVVILLGGNAGKAATANDAQIFPPRGARGPMLTRSSQAHCRPA